MKKYGLKIPPIYNLESVKVYRNPRMRAELPEIFTIDVVLHNVQNVQKNLRFLIGPPPNFGLVNISKTLKSFYTIKTMISETATSKQNGAMVILGRISFRDREFIVGKLRC
jgi:hypothetical protein